MIKNSSIQLAEMIAVGHMNQNVQGSDIVNGLVNVSYGTAPYTQNGFREEIAEVTSEITNHTEIKDATTTRLADIIRESLYNVRDYGVPLAKAVAEGGGFIFSNNKLADVIGDLIRIEYVSLDDSFFESDLFPKSVNDQTLGYERIDLSMLKRLSFEYPDRETVAKLVETSNPEVRAVVDSLEEDLLNAVYILTDVSYLENIFHVDGEGRFNFTQIKTIRTNLLLKMYIVLTKMYASEDPVAFLRGGDIGDYRQYVNLLWNGVTRYLINLRQSVAVYRSMGLVIQPVETVRLTEHPQNLFKAPGLRVAIGEVRVFYSDAALALATEQDTTLNQVVTGHFWNQLAGGVGIVNGPITSETVSKAVSEFNSYVSYVSSKVGMLGAENFIKNGLRSINDYLNSKPELIERINKLRAERNQEQTMWSTWVEATFAENLLKCYHLAIESSEKGAEETEDRLYAFMGSSLVTDFLRSLGANLAAEIIEKTSIKITNGEDNTADKRQRLHVALIETLASKLIVG